MLTSSCQSKTFPDEEALVAYLKEASSGCFHEKTINGITYSLLYRPTDLLVRQELGEKATRGRIEELRKRYNRYLYFNLSISKNNRDLLSAIPQNENEFAAMVQQLTFDIGDKIHLFTPQRDTIELVDFIYPRMYGLSKGTSFLLVYPRKEKKLEEDHLIFTIEDLGLYTSKVTFKMSVEPIKEEPGLSFL